MEKKRDIEERTIQYSLRIINLYRVLESDNVGRIIGKQVLRSRTSIGANVHEAQGGQSRADFIAKMSIAYKEARETHYWLRLIREADLVTAARIAELYLETEELIKIIGTILVNTKRQPRKNSDDHEE